MTYKLSILLVTYNHEKYISEALESLIRQAIVGEVELIVADDCSTDQTLSIIRSFEGRDPRFHFKYLESPSNLGITRNYQRGFAACTGQYVAVLEGDDYWTGPAKLMRQIEFLDYHWECDLCAVNYLVYEEERCQFTPRIPIGFGHRFIGARDLINDNLIGNFSTCLYRKSALERLPPALFEIKSYDWIVNICVARYALIGFLEEPKSVYRLHDGGTWTLLSQAEKLKTQLELIPLYDKLTDGCFHSEFLALASRLESSIFPAQLSAMIDHVAPPVNAGILTLRDYCPPFIYLLAQLIIPPRAKTLIAHMIHRLRK